jgi:protein involved in temperature-dependent protein secretion
MSAPTDPGAQPDPGEDCPAATSVGGLARDLEALRRDVRGLSALSRRVEEMGQLVTRLAEATTAAATTTGHADEGAVSWIDADLDPHDPSVAEAMLTRLAQWVTGVYLRYPDAKLPDCWLWHPEVVEELLWLHQAWLAAYAEGGRRCRRMTSTSTP